MADCAGTASSLDDWTFFIEIAITQCNNALRLLQNRLRFNVSNVHSSTDMWAIPHFKEANDNYMRLINDSNS